MKRRNMEPPAADLKSFGRTVCSPQRQWGFVCSYSAHGAIGKCEAFCGNTTANRTLSPSVNGFFWVVVAFGSSSVVLLEPYLLR